MKIVNTDNFGGDYPDEKFVENLPFSNKEKLQKLCMLINKLNDDGEGMQARYFRVVEDDYKLVPGFEP